MSISQNFPAIRPTLNLNFARSKTLDPRITFTRSSTATYIDSDGLVKTAGVNQARFDHDPVTGESLGLLIEEIRSNLIIHSTISTVTGWSINISTVTDNATTAPDGTNSAARIQESPDGYVADLNILVTAGQTYTFSFWVKSVSGSGTWGINIYDQGGANIGHHRTTVNVTEEWSRVEYSYTPTGTLINVYVSDNRSNLATISDAYVWGAQVEEGSFSTSYIPTSGSAVTRSTDFSLITGTNFSSFYNQTEGTFVSSWRRNSAQPNANVVSVDDGTSNNRIELRATGANSNFHRFDVSVSGSYGTVSINDQPNNGIGNLDKVALAYANNDYAATADGSPVSTDDSSGVPVVNRLGFGNSTYGIHYIGTVSSLAYYPTRLTNSQLQNLTK